MAIRSLHEINALLLGDFRFFNHDTRDYSSNGNDIDVTYGGFGTSRGLFEYCNSMGLRGLNCKQTYATYPSSVTGSFTMEFFGNISYEENGEDFYFIDDLTGGYYILYDELDFGSTVSPGSGSGTLNTPYGRLVHFVYTRSISAGPTLDDEYVYINGYQLSLSGASGTGDLTANFNLLYGNGVCFTFKLYDDYLTQGEVSSLFQACKRSVSSESFFFPLYDPYVAP